MIAFIGNDGQVHNYNQWEIQEPFFSHLQIVMLEGPLWPKQMSSVQNPCWLMIGDYTTQYIEDYNNPIGESY